MSETIDVPAGWENTVDEEHSLLLFSGRSENSDWILQWWPMGKNIFKYK